MRMLNSVEKAWLHIGDRGSANAIRCFRVAGPLTYSLACRCFNAMLDIFPILKCRIVHKDNVDFFEEEESARPRVVYRQGSCALGDIGPLVEDLLNRRIDPRSEPLIQFVFLESPTNKNDHLLLVNSHHSISDGATKIAFMSHFLQLCDAALESERAFASTLASLKAVQEWSPSLILGFPTQGRLAKYSALLSFMRRRIFKEATHHWARLSCKTAQQNKKSRVLQCNWEARFSERLKSAGKAHGLTVHALFCAALMKAFQTTLFPQSRSTDISCVSFVNMRNQCVPAIPDGALGCYISAAFTFHHVSENCSIEQLAKDLAVQLKEASERDVKQQAAYAALMARAMLALGRRTVATLSVSNIGNVTKALRAREFKVTEVHVHSALTGIGSNLSVGLTTAGQNFSVDFTFIEGVLEVEEVGKVATSIREILDDFLSRNLINTTFPTERVSEQQGLSM